MEWWTLFLSMDGLEWYGMPLPFLEEGGHSDGSLCSLRKDSFVSRISFSISNGWKWIENRYHISDDSRKKEKKKKEKGMKNRLDKTRAKLESFEISSDLRKKTLNENRKDKIEYFGVWWFHCRLNASAMEGRDWIRMWFQLGKEGNSVPSKGNGKRNRMNRQEKMWLDR